MKTVNLRAMLTLKMLSAIVTGTVVIAVSYIFIIMPQQQRAEENKQRKANALRECLKDQANIPKGLRTSGTYIDCRALYK